MTNTPPVSKKAYWIGWVLSVIPGLLFLFSASGKLIRNPAVTEGFEHLGWPARYGFPIGVLELVCTIVYLIPKTAVLGAILMTGYLGGAIATHVRLGEPIYLHVAFGIIIWLGIFLRDPRLRELLPLRK
ncbi:MAG: DoxX family protein [Anaerolineae bacterium]|nr:DoxX family protein [Phycisphaerae bacterium]